MKSSALRTISIILAICAFCGLLAACNDTGTVPEQTSAATDAPTQTGAQTTEAETEPVFSEVRALVSDGTGNYTVIRPTKMGSAGVNAAVELIARLKELCGVKLSISEDFVKDPSEIDPNACEVLFGLTNRTGESELPAKGFSIRTERNRVVILARKEAYLRYAAEYFVNTILSDPELAEVGEGKIILKKDIDYVSEEFSYLQEVISSSADLRADVEYLFTVPYPDDLHKNPQGGFMDREGKYYYQVFLNRDNTTNEAGNQDIIIKYDVQTHKIVGRSGELSLNHANDITWFPEKNALIVVHNNPNRGRISFVDPDTLQVVDSTDIGMNIYCMDYSEKLDRFVIGVSGGQNFRFLKNDFKMTDRNLRMATSLTAGYTTQGCSADDNYIYFVLYNENVITVYDWSGNFVSLIHFDVGTIEPENISVVNDEIYVTCNKNGAAVYRITPKP